MKNILKWTLFILIASVAMAAGMFCLAQYFDSKEGDCDCGGNCDCKASKPAKISAGLEFSSMAHIPSKRVSPTA